MKVDMSVAELSLVPPAHGNAVLCRLKPGERPISGGHETYLVLRDRIVSFDAKGECYIWSDSYDEILPRLVPLQRGDTVTLTQT